MKVRKTVRNIEFHLDDDLPVITGHFHGLILLGDCYKKPFSPKTLLAKIHGIEHERKIRQT